MILPKSKYIYHFYILNIVLYFVTDIKEGGHIKLQTVKFGRS